MTAHIKDLFNLSDRVAIVTGGSRGLGKEMAEGLAEAGASLMLCARREEWLTPTVDEFRGRGFRVEGQICDVVNPTQVQAVVDATVAAYGKVDILVNNAGVSWGQRPEDMPLDKWQKVIDINLTGVFLCNRAVAAGMAKRGRGRIVNIASVAGKEGNPNASAYSASKAGVMGLTKSLGKELATTGVLVNCVAPAVVKTELFSQMTEQHIQYMLSKIPMNRFGEVEEVAEMVAWLASDLCTFATGATFDLSGGRATY